MELLDGKNLVPALYRTTRAIGWLLNHGNQSKQTKMCHFLHEVLFECLQTACTRTFAMEFMGFFGLYGLMRGKKGVALLVFVWSPESEGWPR